MSAGKRRLRPSPKWLLWLAPFILIAPVWLNGQALYWGTPSTQFVPWWWQAWLTLRAGEWPLWNPLVGMGAPLIANYQSALFYPANWLYFLLAAAGGLSWMAWGQAILAAAHLAFAGWGMAKLLEKLGITELGQLVGGLAFSLSGYLVARAHFLSINAAVAWLPWVLLAAYEVATAKRAAQPTLKLALFLSLQWLAGHAQLAAYTLLLAGAWALFWALQARQPGWPRVIGRFAAAAAGALALSAVQLLPTVEYLLNSQRAEQVSPALAMTYSFWPWRFLTLLAPNLFGSPALGNYAGYGNYWEDAIYIGLLPLLLAVFAVARGRRGEAPRTNLTALRRFLIGVVLVSFVLALGSNTPLFPWLFEHVPGFALFQAPSRMTIWAIFAIAVLTAIGVERWRQPTGRGLYWGRLALAAGVAISLGGLAAGALRAAGRLDMPASFVSAAALLGINALIVAGLNLWVWRLPVARRTWLVSLLIAADLLAAGWGLNPGTSLELYTQRSVHEALRSELGAGRVYLPAADETELKFEHLFRFDSFASEDPRSIRAVLLPNTNLLEQIPSANNFDPFVPARYQLWIDELETADAEQRAVMLRLMNVSVVERALPGEAAVTFEPLPALPRVRVVPCARPAASPQAALAMLGEADFDPEREVIAEGNGLPACAAEVGNAQITSETANKVQVTVSPGGGWLVLADTWYPGWRAIANSEELEIYPANGLFRAVQLPQYATSVEFVFGPLSFTLGLWLTLVAWPAWVFAWRRIRQ